MNILTDPMPQSVRHPEWCHPEYCDHYVDEPRHVSQPDTFTPVDTDDVVGVSLYQDDEVQADGNRITRRRGVRLQVEAPEMMTLHGDPVDVQTVLTPAEARRLAGMLLAQAERAETLSDGADPRVRA